MACHVALRMMVLDPTRQIISQCHSCSTLLFPMAGHGHDTAHWHPLAGFKLPGQQICTCLETQVSTPRPCRVGIIMLAALLAELERDVDPQLT